MVLNGEGKELEESIMSGALRTERVNLRFNWFTIMIRYNLLFALLVVENVLK